MQESPSPAKTTRRDPNEKKKEEKKKKKKKREKMRSNKSVLITSFLFLEIQGREGFKELLFPHSCEMAQILVEH